MMLNSDSSYGLIAIVLHWLMAVAIIGLFVLGLWMVDLDYYHPWYVSAPDIHRGIGVLVFLMLLLRLLMRILNPPPGPVPGIKAWERRTSVLVHWLMYGLMLVVPVAGYLITTADGRSVDVFGWFQVPATLTGIQHQEDVAGELHYLLAITLVALASLHTLAALKHHFLNRDATLRRMLGFSRSRAE